MFYFFWSGNFITPTPSLQTSTEKSLKDNKRTRQKAKEMENVCKFLSSCYELTIERMVSFSAICKSLFLWELWDLCYVLNSWSLRSYNTYSLQSKGQYNTPSVLKSLSAQQNETSKIHFYQENFKFIFVKIKRNKWCLVTWGKFSEFRSTQMLHSSTIRYFQ